MLRFAVILLALAAAAAEAQECGRRWPARAVPECVSWSGDPQPCGTARSLRLWTDRIRPAHPIVADRDASDRLAGKSVPGQASGHELWSSVAATPHRLYAAYNAGLVVWRRPDFAKLDQVDGWAGGFSSFPPVSEKLAYIADVDARVVSPGRDVIVLAGYDPVGTTAWEYSGGKLRQLARWESSVEQVAIVETSGNLWAVLAQRTGPLLMVDLGAALVGSPESPRVIGGRGMYADAMATGGSAIVAHAGGIGTDLRLISWSPAAGPQVLWSGEVREPHGVQVWQQGQTVRLAVVEESRGLNRELLRIFDVGGCVGAAVCRLGSGVEQLLELVIDPATSTANDFLTHSRDGGKSWLYYGVATGNVAGGDVERLWDVDALLAGSSRAEVTAGGRRYWDPCARAWVGYWGHLYAGNRRGVNAMVPRRLIVAGGIGYRAAASVLDSHHVR